MPLTAEEVGRVRAALSAETHALSDEQVASGAADTIVQQAQKIRDLSAATETARQSAAALEQQLADVRAKLPKAIDADVLAEKVANKVEKLDLLAQKGHMTGGQRDALAASLKADPERMLAACAGGVTPIDAAIKVFEMSPPAAVATDGTAKTGPQAPSVVPKAETPGGTVNADPKAVAGDEWDQDPNVRAGFSSRDSYVNFRSAQMRGLIRVA